jgi:hypothetical protein
LLGHPEGDDLMPLGDEGPGQAQELARKILVNESDLHRLPPQARRERKHSQKALSLFV